MALLCFGTILGMVQTTPSQVLHKSDLIGICCFGLWNLRWDYNTRQDRKLLIDNSMVNVWGPNLFINCGGRTRVELQLDEARPQWTNVPRDFRETVHQTVQMTSLESQPQILHAPDPSTFLSIFTPTLVRNTLPMEKCSTWLEPNQTLTATFRKTLEVSVNPQVGWWSCWSPSYFSQMTFLLTFFSLLNIIVCFTNSRSGSRLCNAIYCCWPMH